MMAFEFHRMLHSKSLWLAFAVSCVFSLMNVWYQLNLYWNDVNHISIFYKWMGVSRSNFGPTYFIMVIPLLAALGYSWTISSDVKTGYINQIFTRTSQKRFFFAKYVASFTSGGIIFCGPLVLDYLLLATFSPAEFPQPEMMQTGIDQFHFCSKLFFQHPYLFVLLWLGVGFLWGGAMTSIAVAFGMFHKKG